jgi:hypothetical protein
MRHKLWFSNGNTKGGWERIRTRQILIAWDQNLFWAMCWKTPRFL